MYLIKNKLIKVDIKEFIGYNIEEQFFELFTIKGGFNNGKGKIWKK